MTTRLRPRHAILPERTDLVEVGKGHRPDSFRRCSEAGTAGSNAESKAMANQMKASRTVGFGTLPDPTRKDINRKYDFRSSRLTQVFGRLLCERRVSEEELRGLGRTS